MHTKIFYRLLHVIQMSDTSILQRIIWSRKQNCTVKKNKVGNPMNSHKIFFILAFFFFLVATFIVGS